jgi:hypothetical protein
MNLCVCDSEERDGGVGADVNDSILLMTGTDLLDGDTDTSTVSQRSKVSYRSVSGLTGTGSSR